MHSSLAAAPAGCGWPKVSSRPASRSRSTSATRSKDLHGCRVGINPTGNRITAQTKRLLPHKLR